MNFFNNYLPGIIALCKKHKVKKLFAFGSVLTNRFNDKSEIDLLEEQAIRNPILRKNIDSAKLMIYG